MTSVDELDPFDLPDWLGEGSVVWATDRGLSGHLVAGHLDGTGGNGLPCDLLAVDQAYPSPVLDELNRARVHQAWQHGQVLLLRRDGRALVAAPGTTWTPERVLEAFTRLARAVGADPSSWSVRLALGTQPPR